MKLHCAWHSRAWLCFAIVSPQTIHTDRSHILVNHPHHFVTVNNNKSNDSNNLNNKITRHNFLTDLIFYGGEELENNYAIAKIFSDFLPAHNLFHFTPIYGNSGVGESFRSSF